ncbi:beta-lactamase domain-containing protein [Acrasis kona]|uniref:Beta-lactamase domain-containing protein n=1 Tax=Acrasis kona TaxID=1008807 RepID=A0AAW2ZHM0_9EUKA
MGLLSKLFFIVALLLAVLSYVLRFGATYHTPQCTLFGIQCPNKTVVEGYIHQDYAPLKEFYQAMFDQGEELYSCLAVYEKKEKVVDLCGGNVTTANGEKQFRNIVQNVFSSTKVIVMITVAMLVDRGLLKYDEPIATYWPEYAQGNKAEVTVSDLMAHASGVSFLDKTIPWSVIGTDSNLDELGRLLAEQPHNFDGKRTVGYHALLYGTIANEIVRRVDTKKRTIAEFATQEIIEPLDVKYYFGLPEHLEKENFSYFYDHPAFNMFAKIIPRVLFNIPFVPSLGPNQAYLKDALKGEPSSPVKRSFGDRIFGEGSPHLDTIFHTPEYRRLQHMTGTNGFTQATSLAKIGQIMIDGTVDGIKFLSEETRSLAMTPLPTEFDLVLTYNMTRCVGGFGVVEVPSINATLKGWTGFGGSVMLFDSENEISFGYVPGVKGGQFISVDDRIVSLMEEFYRLNKH